MRKNKYGCQIHGICMHMTATLNEYWLLVTLGSCGGSARRVLRWPIQHECAIYVGV